eukprot:2648999-Amphidinium_carterae.1
MGSVMYMDGTECHKVIANRIKFLTGFSKLNSETHVLVGTGGVIFKGFKTTLVLKDTIQNAQ